MASNNIHRFGMTMRSNNYENRHERPGVYSSVSRILDTQTARREVLIHQIQQQCAADKSRTNAVLERLGLSIQRCTRLSLQPPAGSRRRPESSVQGRRLRPIEHVPPCNAETSRTQRHQSSPKTQRGEVEEEELRAISLMRSHIEMSSPHTPTAPSQTEEEEVPRPPVAPRKNPAVLTFTQAPPPNPAPSKKRGTRRGVPLRPAKTDNVGKKTDSTVEQDLSPEREIDEELRRMIRNIKMRQQAKMEREKVAKMEERNQMPQLVYTSAQPRYNMCISLNDNLPQPRLYRAMAPFIPKPGGHMKHLREPTLKPIEI